MFPWYKEPSQFILISSYLMLAKNVRPLNMILSIGRKSYIVPYFASKKVLIINRSKLSYLDVLAIRNHYGLQMALINFKEWSDDFFTQNNVISKKYFLSSIYCPYQWKTFMFNTRKNVSISCLQD